MTKIFYQFLIIAFIITLLSFFFLSENNVKLVSFIFSIFLFWFIIVLFLNLDFSVSHANDCYSLQLFYGSSEILIYFDVISGIFLLLVVYIMPIVILLAWYQIKFFIKFFYFNIILLEFFLINAFLTLDIFFFYIWFESTIIPMFFIIIIWGNNYRKIKAVFYLIVFTLVFSTPLSFSILYLQFTFGSTNFFFLAKYIVLTKSEQKFLCLFFFLAFAVKTPLFPMHIWLPEAHVEAPTVGSVILAGLLLKLGIYGILRFCVGLFPFGLLELKPFFLVMCIIGCIYGSLLALSQQDIKKIIAYSSVAHMSLVVMGLLSNNVYGIAGGILLAVGHTVVSSALFILVGILYERFHSRLIDYFSGLSTILPIFSFFFFHFIISNFGFPISGNFIGEFLIFIGVGFLNIWVLLTLVFYSFLSVAYNLFLYLRVCHGSIRFSFFKVLFKNDMNKLEIYILILLVLVNIVLCFFPANLLAALTTACFTLVV